MCRSLSFERRKYHIGLMALVMREGIKTMKDMKEDFKFIGRACFVCLLIHLVPE